MTLVPVQVTFRGGAASNELDAETHERIEWLEQFYAGLVRSRVLVEVPHRHPQGGRHFHVRVEVTVPGGPPIIVDHEPSLGRFKDVEDEAHHREAEIDRVHQYASVAVRDAFDAAHRRLEDFAREQRGAVKVHDVPAP